MKRLMLITLVSTLALLLLTGFGTNGSASDADETKLLLERSRITFEEFVGDKNFNWFQENVRDAKGILIIPEMFRAGFFWGGSGGTGVLVVRDKGTNVWSQPVFYSIGSVSFGLQIGTNSAQVVMLAMSQEAIDSLYASSVKFGGDISAALGTTGAGVKKTLTADFISFSKAKGIYAGLDVEGSVIRVRDDLNKAYYGREVSPVEIIVKREVYNPASAALLNFFKTQCGDRC